ncbi:acyltransferase family protein [Nonomuraea pusilla]|uniref:acyltransferase family protein n=1 Tax=Nonomuraea pusilla TaxID=46177 RepID=UPI00331AA90B
MSDTKYSPPVTAPSAPDGPGEDGGPAHTGSRWPMPQGAVWGDRTDPEGLRPGLLREQVERGEADASAQGPQAAEAEEPKPKRKRDPYLDNVKFVLIALVVLGHSLVPTLDADSSRAAYIFIYMFHMPLFVMISGYLSRNFWNSNAKTNKLVDTFVVPYVIVEVGYAALRFSLGQKWSLTIIDPAWLNWYLLALLFWRLSTPVWKRMKHPVPVSIAIYVFAGYSQIAGDFSMDRFFGLMPFFVLGLVMQPEHFELLNRRWVKILSAVTLLCAAGVAIYIAPKAPLDPFYFKHSYQDMDLSWWMGPLVRIGLLVCSLAMCFAVLSLVPRGETWYSDLGTRTLYAYLLHGIPVLIAKDQGWLDLPWLHGPLGVLAIASSTFALAIILCLPETRTVFKWLLEPRLTWLYRRPSRS